MPRGLIVIGAASEPDAAGWAPDEGALAPVANRPLVAHAIDAVRGAGADEVIVVGEAESSLAVREALGPDGGGLRWVSVPHPVGEADAILAAASLLEGDRFLVHVAEGLVTREHALLAHALADRGADAAVFFQDERMTGVHAFDPGFVATVQDTPPGADGQRSLADAVDRLARSGGTVRAGVLDGWWRYHARAHDLLRVNRLVLDGIEPDIDGTDLADARLEGRVRVHPTARVRNAVISGPAIIGAHARVTDAYVGPYTSIGDRAVIENAEIASSIVLPGARIRHVGVRVEDSIVGAGATVGRDFSLPKAMRILVGRDAHITFS